MAWGAKPVDYKCEEKNCNEKFQFIMDTMFIEINGGLPKKCPKCRSKNITKIIKPIN